MDHLFGEFSESLAESVPRRRRFGKSVIGGLFAKIYSKDLDRAIPLLVRGNERKSGVVEQV
jgi:hypothetical protein